MSVVPIRPDLPVSIESEALRFCEDVVGDFVGKKGEEPSGAILILFGSDGYPIVNMTEIHRGDLSLAGAWLTRYALGEVSCD